MARFYFGFRVQPNTLTERAIEEFIARTGAIRSAVEEPKALASLRRMGVEDARGEMWAFEAPADSFEQHGDALTAIWRNEEFVDRAGATDRLILVGPEDAKR